MKKIIALLFLLSGSVAAQENHEQWITIFVHGIMNIQPHLTTANIIRFWTDQIEESVYTKAIELLRKDPYFTQYHAMQGMGLQKIDMNCVQEGAASTALACVYDEIAKKNESTTRINTFYTFGWSGLLSRRMRRLEAEILYKKIIKELHEYHKQKIYPKVRLIGYSHGGSLVINLGAVHRKLNHQQAHIDELILLGVPIIQENYHDITSSLFKKIYHIYSWGDRVQPLDWLTGASIFSARTFESNGSFKVPEHLVHLEYRLKRIAHRNPFRKQKRFHKRLLRNADPGHTELWSFGWVHKHRPYLPTYPLPAVSFTTYLTQAIEANLSESSRVTVDIRPYNETLILTDQHTSKTVTLDFMTNKELAKLRKKAERYRPTNFNEALFDKKVAQALKVAERTLEAERKSKVRVCKRCGNVFTPNEKVTA